MNQYDQLQSITMAKLPFSLLLFYALITTTTVLATSDEADQWIRKLPHAKQKLTNLHFFFHDTITGPDPTAVIVAKPPPKNPASLFGTVIVMDDPLTVGPDPTSKLVGRAQGLYAAAALSMQNFALALSMNLVFTSGRFNGSSLAILGRNPVLHATRELPIVGGTGVFRLARGFATLTTHSINTTTGNAIVEYNVKVIHY